MSTGTTYSFSPNTVIPENEKYRDNGKWFNDNALYVASQWNNQLANYPNTMNGGIPGINGAAMMNVGAGTWWSNPYWRMIAFYQYYDGRQINRDYAFSQEDLSGELLNVKWIPGQKVTTLIKYLEGAMLATLKAAKPSIKSASPAAYNRRTELIEKSSIYFDLKDVFQDFEAMGVSFSPLGGKEQDFELPEKAYEWIEYDYKERLEVIAKDLLNDFLARINYIEYFGRVAKEALICGVCGSLPYTHNNRVWLDFILPTELIWDNSKDEQQNRNARFCGYIRYMTPTEILANIPGLTEDQINALKKANVDTDVKGVGSMPAMPFRDSFVNQGLVLIPVIRTYWRGMKDTRYKEVKDDIGVEHLVKLKGDKKKNYNAEIAKIRANDPDAKKKIGELNKEKKEAEQLGDYLWETWYKATIIGGLGLCDYGECYNHVEKLEDRARLEPPIDVWAPEITRGDARSYVSRLYQHQDRKDFLMNEITKMIDNSMGKVFVFRSSKLGTKNIPQLYSDFKRYRISAIDLDASGDPDNPIDQQRLGEEIDLTFDQNLTFYLQLMDKEDALMEEIASVSKISLGQQSQYIGLATQQATIAQNSYGNSRFMESYMEYFARVCQKAINIQKNLLINEEENSKIPVVGDRGIKFLKLIGDLSLEDFGVYVSINDIISEKGKEVIMAMAQAWSQNPEFGVMPQDFVKMTQLQTYTELYNYMEYVFKRNERKQVKQEQQMQMMAQIQAQQAHDAQQQMVDTKEEGQNQRQMMKSETELAKEEMKLQNQPETI